MKIEPKEGVLLIKLHKNTSSKVSLVSVEEDEERNLITGEVLKGNFKGKTVIFGKYALYTVKIQGESYSFLREEDIVGFCDYTEK